MQQENKLLKEQIESKFDTETFSLKQKLDDTIRERNTLEQQNKALENRIEQLNLRSDEISPVESSMLEMKSK